jgi:Ohr subfamily peroxiredoxin
MSTKNIKLIALGAFLGISIKIGFDYIFNINKPKVLDKILYTSNVHTTGGREDGKSTSDDGKLNIFLSAPGSKEPGANPEQLFGSGYSACFIAALKLIAEQEKIILPNNIYIDSIVNLGTVLPSAFGISLTLKINLEMDRNIANKLIQSAHEICPYSNATRGNIVVDIVLV